MSQDTTNEQLGHNEVGGLETPCDVCGKRIRMGEWPFCPHGFPIGGLSVIDDQLDGGARFFEHLGPTPVFIESKSQWRRELAARNLDCVGERKPASYFAKQRKMHDEQLRDTRKDREHAGYRE